MHSVQNGFLVITWEGYKYSFKINRRGSDRRHNTETLTQAQYWVPCQWWFFQRLVTRGIRKLVIRCLRIGYVISFSGFPTLWSFSFQKKITLTIINAEYIALSQVYIYFLRERICLSIKIIHYWGALYIFGPDYIYEDKNGITALARTP